MSEECFAFNGKAFGVRVPSKATLDDWKKKGWLGENGICAFPMDVQAKPSGVKTSFPIKWWKTATEEQIYQAIISGAVTFGDGNGDYYTLDEYKKLYPNYPDPELRLRIEGRFPPDPANYKDLDDRNERKNAEIKFFQPRM
ncbi:MAG: hypothetical protein NTX42_12315 [Methanothrix sp.]|nr:hypothetical protein [Methanothrix sp.]